METHNTIITRGGLTRQQFELRLDHIEMEYMRALKSAKTLDAVTETAREIAMQRNMNMMVEDLIVQLEMETNVFVFNNSLTPAARMSPSREAKRVATRAVKPSFVSVAECEIGNTDNRAEASTTDHSSAVVVAVTPSADAVARDIGQQGNEEKRVVFGASLTNTCPLRTRRRSLRIRERRGTGLGDRRLAHRARRWPRIAQGEDDKP